MLTCPPEFSHKFGSGNLEQSTLIDSTMSRYPPSSQKTNHNDLGRFAGIVWGNPQAVLKKHPEGFEYIDLSGYLKAFRTFFAGMVTHDKLLVTNEYRIALQELQGDAYQAGACVVGQPGIGESQTTFGAS